MPYKDPQKQRAAQRASLERTREARRLRQREKRQALRDWIIEVKSGVPCADCDGRFHHAAMHFDHLPGSQKVAGIREMVNRFQSKALIEEEMKKCELVCANCHAVRTFERNHSRARPSFFPSSLG